MVIRPCTFARGIKLEVGMAWEASQWAFCGVGRACFFRWRLLDVFDVEDFVDGVGLVGLDGCFFGLELLEVFDVEDFVDGVGPVGLDGCFFGLELLEVFDVENLHGVGLVGLDNFWVACEFFDWEGLVEGDGVFVRRGVVEGGGVMLGVSR